LPPPPRATLFPYTTLFRSIQDDGKIIVVGQANLGPTPNSPGTYIGFAVRYNSNGTLDTSFGTNGIYKLTSSRQFVSVMALPNGSDRKSTRLNSSHVKISYA